MKNNTRKEKKNDPRKENMKEMSLNELEEVSGGGAVNMMAKRKATKKIIKWICSWFD